MEEVGSTRAPDIYLKRKVILSEKYSTAKATRKERLFQHLHSKYLFNQIKLCVCVTVYVCVWISGL